MAANCQGDGDHCTEVNGFGMGGNKEVDQDKALVMEPITSSGKLGLMEKTDPGLPTRDQVGIIATQDAAKVTGHGEKKTFDIDAENHKWKKISPGRATQARHTGARPTQGAAVSPIANIAPAQIAGRLIYHGRNFVPIAG